MAFLLNFKVRLAKIHSKVLNCIIRCKKYGYLKNTRQSFGYIIVNYKLCSFHKKNKKDFKFIFILKMKIPCISSNENT